MTFHSGYQSYLIRFQQVHNAQPDDQAAWHITLDNIQTGERLVFGAPQMLYDYFAGCFLLSEAALLSKAALLSQGTLPSQGAGSADSGLDEGRD